MAQTGSRPGIKRGTKLGPDMVARFLNRDKPGPKLALHFMAGLAPGLEFSTRVISETSPF